jgi:hypothetical protein
MANGDSTAPLLRCLSQDAYNSYLEYAAISRVRQSEKFVKQIDSFQNGR